jgi:hypothetical protein
MNTFSRNLFEIENARNLTRDELVATFVATPVFWRLLSAKNHVVLGSRGSGKTALAKMLSHDHLAQMDDERARQIIAAKAFIGIYVPTTLEWVGGLKNKPWQTEREKEEFFQWRLNVSTCLAFLTTIRSCLNTYTRSKGDRARLEQTLIAKIAESWSDGQFTCDTIRLLQNHVEDIEHKKQLQLARRRAQPTATREELTGIAFETELFQPLRRGITLASRLLNLPDDSIWLLCLDEAEFLEPLHHRIINSHMRAYSGNVFFKITTMPYAHYTLSTNTAVPLNEGDDFEYVYIDHDPILWAGSKNQPGRKFASMLFNKRAKFSAQKYWNVKLRDLLGRSTLLDSKVHDWTRTSTSMELLKKHASSDTLNRANRLREDPKSFQDQIGRKIYSALILREAVKNQKGRRELDVYSGESMVVRCGDGNPRRLIRLFNDLLLSGSWEEDLKTGMKVYKLSPREQTRVLIAFSTSSLIRVQSEPECGPELYEFLRTIGEYMRYTLHNIPLKTDQISSVLIDRNISDRHWLLVQRAVGFGLLFPNTGANNPDQMPNREGTFHFAYVLAPHFRILPRRGRAHSLSAILKFEIPQLEHAGGSNQRDFEFGKNGEAE